MSNQTFLEFIGAKDRVPNGYWKDIENCKIFMKWLGRKLGYKTTEDWYKVSAKNFKHNGANSILREYGSHINLIKSIFPEYDWLEWKFTYVSKGFWKDVENCKIYMNWLGRKLGYKTLEDWYKVSGKNFTDNGGGGLLNNYHNASHINLIKSVFPDYEWLEWKFVCAPNRFWKDIKMICYVCNLSISIPDCIFCKELTHHNIMYRHDVPNKYDEAAFGSIIRVNKKDDRFDIYRNISREMQSPHWEYEGNFKE